MDFVAHGLWATAAGAAANRKAAAGKRVRLLYAFLWGVFPDAFAFSPMFVALLWFGSFGERFTPRLLFSRALHQVLPASLWPENLYPISHSLVIFAVVFATVWLLRRRPVPAMLAWPLHILFDIPTHGSGIYRTPFLWPVSSYRFDGIWWSRRWFMMLNYGALAAAGIVLLILSLRSRQIQRLGERVERSDSAGVTSGVSS